MNPPSIRQRVSEAKRRLVRAGIPEAEAGLDARLLAQHVKNWDSTTYVLEAEQPATSAFDAAFDALVRRREKREPIAYVLGHQEFCGLDIAVTPDVLIPRPETELLIEIAQELLRAGRPLRLADVGTGSGCVAVALARTFPLATVTATDTSAAALDVARKNAERHGVAGRITFVHTSLLDHVDEGFDFIASNPPYVAETTRDALQAEVRDFEPPAALFAGADGLGVIRRLLHSFADRLQVGAPGAFEFGFGQADQVKALIEHVPGIALRAIRNDLQGIPRAAVVVRT